MDSDSLKLLLERVKAGDSSPEEALRQISAGGLSHDMGYARLDLSRKARCGFPEFIFGEGKTPEQICGIMGELAKTAHPVLATRVSPEAATKALALFPDAVHDSLAKTLSIKRGVVRKAGGKVLVVTAGTSDLPVALEAKTTAELCGCDTELLADAGVAGMHRLLGERGALAKAAVIIAVAGMEGALPSVVAGLVPCPVIAVPTSVGYGASFKGIAALLAMLNSCASGVLVTNIDNGFGAGCAAARILESGSPKG